MSGSVAVARRSCELGQRNAPPLAPPSKGGKVGLAHAVGNRPWMHPLWPPLLKGGKVGFSTA